MRQELARALRSISRAAIEAARECQAGSPVTSPAAREASTEGMLLLAPRYGSDSVKSAFQDSTAQPSASDQKCCSMAAAAAARTAAAPGIPAAVALDDASSTCACA